MSLNRNQSFLEERKLYFMLIYHLQKHVLKTGPTEADKEGLCCQQAGGGNFSPVVVINSNCCKLSQSSQLHTETNYA